MHKKLLKLAKMILNFEQTETDKGALIHEGELAVGVEVFKEDENGELVPAEDGEYIADDKVIVVSEGKVAEIKEQEPKEPDIKEQALEDAQSQLAEKDARIAELEGAIAEKDAAIEEKDARIAELEAQLEELKAKLAESDARSAEEELKMSKQTKVKENKITFNLYK